MEIAERRGIVDIMSCRFVPVALLVVSSAQADTIYVETGGPAAAVIG